MSFPYKHVLLIGATSGIGAAMASHLIANDIKVTAVGRRKDRLDQFVAQHGSEKASGIVFDVSDVDKAPTFASSVLQSHSSIDCIFLNAGMQRRYDFSSPDTCSLATFNQEMTTNFTALVALTHAFLPHLIASSSPRGIIYTGTHIGIVPVAAMPAYSASKAALDAFTMCLREQLKQNPASSNVKVTYVSPPLVQSEIHNFEMGPSGEKMGMPAEEFTKQTWAELVKGEEHIVIGTIGGSTREQFLEMVELREGAFDRINELMRQLTASHGK